MPKNNYSEFFFDTQSFNKKESSWDFWKYPVIFISSAIVIAAICAFIIASAQKPANTKRLQLHQIEVNTFGASTLYITTEYKIDSVTKCIQFKDAMGLKRKVCDHYTITTYFE